MKLSQFKKKTYMRKISFINGVMETTDNSVELNGEIYFYDLDNEQMKRIQDEVIDKSDENEADEKFIYRLIPYISNIECDVTYEEYLDMIENPSKEFAVLIDSVIACMKVVFEKSDALINLKNNSDNLTNEVDVNKYAKELEKIKKDEKHKESQLEKLYTQLSTATDKNARKKILKKITELEAN